MVIGIKEIESRITTTSIWPNLDLTLHVNKRDFKMVNLFILSA